MRAYFVDIATAELTAQVVGQFLATILGPIHFVVGLLGCDSSMVQTEEEEERSQFNSLVTRLRAHKIAIQF